LNCVDMLLSRVIFRTGQHAFRARCFELTTDSIDQLGSQLRGALAQRLSPLFQSFREKQRRYCNGQSGRFHMYVPLRLRDAKIVEKPCATDSPKRVQKAAPDMYAIKTLSQCA